MGQVKKAFMEETMDDMADVSIGDLHQAHNDMRLWELTKYTVEELEAELSSRGWKVVSK